MRGSMCRLEVNAAVTAVGVVFEAPARSRGRTLQLMTRAVACYGHQQGPDSVLPLITPTPAARERYDET